MYRAIILTDPGKTFLKPLKTLLNILLTYFESEFRKMILKKSSLTSPPL